MNKRFKNTIITICALVVVVYAAVTYIKDTAEINSNGEIFGDDYVEFFDVGQGDCALISSNGRNCLIDTGTSSSSDTVVNKLNMLKVKNVDLISISHFHADHTGGLYDFVKKLNVDNLLYPKEFSDTGISNDILYSKREVLAQDGEFVVSNAGQTINVGDFKLSVLYQNLDSDDENNRSVYIMAKIDDKKFFFTGDGEKQTEYKLLDKNINLDCDVLKVPHHGGSTSSSDAFLDECNPRYAVISCGKDNIYGHPHKETINRLKSRNIKTFRTDQNGDIAFSIVDGKISISTEK